MSILSGLWQSGTMVAEEFATKLETSEARRKRLRAEEHEEMQTRGRKAFSAYYSGAPYALAKLDHGMVFTPEMVAYLERENENRRIAKEIFDENIKGEEAQPDVVTVAPAASHGGKPGSDHAGDGGGESGKI